MFSELHLGSDRVSAQISALKYEVTIRVGYLRPFDNLYLKAVQKELANQPLKQGFEPHRRVPSTLEMILHIFDENTPHQATWQQSAITTGVAIAFCCLLRPSEYLSHTGSDCHVLRAASVIFECNFPGNPHILVLSSHLHAMQISWDMVSAVKILFTSAKNISTRWGHSLWFSAPKGEAVLNLPQILFEWSIAAQPQPDDVFLSWPIPNSTRKCRNLLRYEIMQQVVKDAAVFFGFSPKNSDVKVCAQVEPLYFEQWEHLTAKS
jgi:hypothetical protein